MGIRILHDCGAEVSFRALRSIHSDVLAQRGKYDLGCNSCDCSETRLERQIQRRLRRKSYTSHVGHAVFLSSLCGNR